MILTIKSVEGIELNISHRFYKTLNESREKREMICKVCGREASPEGPKDPLGGSLSRKSSQKDNDG